MGRRNKGGSRAKRSASAQAAERKRMAKMRAVMAVLGDDSLTEERELMEAHVVLFSCLRSVEVAMQENGINVPEKYVEHRVSEVRQDRNKDYVPCRRCIFNKVAGEDGIGKIGECQQFRFADGGKLRTSREDGCGRGILREEYA